MQTDFKRMTADILHVSEAQIEDDGTLAIVVSRLMESMGAGHERARNIRVLQLRYQGLTLIEIGNRAGISPERVRQICGKLLRRLSHPLRSKELERFLNEKTRVQRSNAKRFTDLQLCISKSFGASVNILEVPPEGIPVICIENERDKSLLAEVFGDTGLKNIEGPVTFTIPQFPCGVRDKLLEVARRIDAA